MQYQEPDGVNIHWYRIYLDDGIFYASSPHFERELTWGDRKHMNSYSLF